MSTSFEILTPGNGDKETFVDFITQSDAWFTPPLSTQTDITVYANKLYTNGVKFICHNEDGIIGACVAYINKAPDFSFGTYLVVNPVFDGLGIGLKLISMAIDYSEKYGSRGFKLNMRAENKMLLRFYQKKGFEITDKSIYTNTDIEKYELTKIF